MAFSKFAFLFNKFQQGVGVLAKNTTFAKNPRQLQFEADINKLFMFTSYNRLGRDAEEADAEEIIEIAGKATLSEQQKQVQENIHYQVQNFCSLMDEILLTDIDKTKVLNESGSESKSGNNVPTADKPIYETKPLKLAEVSQHLKDRIGYTLQVKPSLIPHKVAGQGCFIEGEADVGAILAFYPGVIYAPALCRYLPGCPTQNSYLITRYDGTVINAQPWGRGGESREKWNGSVKPSKTRTDATTVKMLSKPLEGFGSVEAVLEMRNPLAFGHFINHSSKDMDSNVMICPYDFPLSEKEMRVYIPNIYFESTEDMKKMGRFGSFWSRRENNSSLDALVLKTLVVVATRALCNEELMIINEERRPEWYTQVDEEEDRRKLS